MRGEGFELERSDLPVGRAAYRQDRPERGRDAAAAGLRRLVQLNLISVVFRGNDATSGLASCSSSTYPGRMLQVRWYPEAVRTWRGTSGLGLSPSITTPCRRRRRRSTPCPAIAGSRLPGRTRRFLIRGCAPLAEPGPVMVTRGPGHHHRLSLGNKRRYRYVVTLIDQAGTGLRLRPAASDRFRAPSAVAGRESS